MSDRYEDRDNPLCSKNHRWLRFKAWVTGRTFFHACDVEWGTVTGKIQVPTAVLGTIQIPTVILGVGTIPTVGLGVGTISIEGSKDV